MSFNKQSDIIVPSAQNISFCIVLLLILWANTFLPFAPAAEASAEPVRSFIFSKISEFISPDSFFGKILGLILFAFTCFVLQKLNEEFSFIRVRTILPPLIFVVVGSLLVPHTISPSIITVLLLVFSFYAVFLSANSLNPIQCFNVALMLSVASLMVFPAITMILFFLIFLFNCNQLDFRGVFATCFGVLIPYIYFAIPMFVAGTPEVLIDHLTHCFDLFSNDITYTTAELVFFGYMIVSFVFAMLHFSFGGMQDNLKQRKEIKFIITLFIWVATLIALRIPDSEDLLGCAGLLYAIILGRFFSVENSKPSRILFALFVLVSLFKLFA